MPFKSFTRQLSFLNNFKRLHRKYSIVVEMVSKASFTEKSVSKEEIIQQRDWNVPR